MLLCEKQSHGSLQNDRYSPGLLQLLTVHVKDRDRSRDRDTTWVRQWRILYQIKTKCHKAQRKTKSILTKRWGQRAPNGFWQGTKKGSIPNDGATPAKANIHHETQLPLALGTSMSSSSVSRYTSGGGGGQTHNRTVETEQKAQASQSEAREFAV